MSHASVPWWTKQVRGGEFKGEFKAPASFMGKAALASRCQVCTLAHFAPPLAPAVS